MMNCSHDSTPNDGSVPRTTRGTWGFPQGHRHGNDKE